ncbi:hypothetical protein N7533_011771 [Penicillium manginii]|uniref:uncharacterized protein n=1 Tax=Penicillium manginii TaxID=203109 RepID=UPI002546B683|nr:uncharacterized protein N7533_011771 [Penicillium manginii]KAJ5738987.1 hypothetical protein N7533_011771 [Penicillium manginii]
MSLFHSRVSPASPWKSQTAPTCHRQLPVQKRFASTGHTRQGMPRWLPVAIAITIPLAFYMSRGDRQVGPVKGAEANQDVNQTSQVQPSNIRFSEPYDQPRAVGEKGFHGSISSKQEGLSNTDTLNPHINEPGKSQKGEGEVETAKVKGTVSTNRPQV